MMFILDIATWIANFLILGIALVIWCIGIFLMGVICVSIKELINKYVYKP